MISFLHHITEKKLTLEFHKELNPKFWTADKKLVPEVREKLLEIAVVWAEFAGIPKSAVKDVNLLGGNCNYNYTKYSDLDVHLVVDYDKVSSDRNILFQYFMDKKNLFTLNHEISIYGFPVEIFAQPLEEQPKIGQGVYSVKNNKWVQMPNIEDISKYKGAQIGHKVLFYSALINKVLKGKASLPEIDKLKEKIRLMRKAGIEESGEMSFENLVFKELRNKGLLDKLNKFKINAINKELSLEGLTNE
jgi:hypothetical protein